MERKPRVAVIGGVNVDISGTSDTRMLLGDSNPGRVAVTLGGVGRNIAECLARLGAEVELVTCLGEDTHTAAIRRSCEELGIGLSLSAEIPGERNGSYLCLNDVNGDVFAAVSDMSVCEHITPAFLLPRMEAIGRCSLVVVDANIPGEAIAFLAAQCAVPLAADPVSVKKAERLRGHVGRMALLKPNRAEAELLSGVTIRGTDGLAAAADVLLGEGAQSVFISLGAGGVYYSGGGLSGIQPCLGGRVVNTNGCGDAFLAAVCIARLRGCGLAEQARIGQAASALNARSERAVNPLLRWEALI